MSIFARRGSLLSLLGLLLLSFFARCIAASPVPANAVPTSTEEQTDQAPTSSLPQDVTGANQEQTTLFGNDHHWRDQLNQRGIKLTLVYTGEIQSNVAGGRSQGTIYDGLLNGTIDLDLESITGFWKNAVLHTNAIWVAGNSLSSRYIGDFSIASNIAAPNGVRLQELWLEQALWNKQFTIRLGLLAADTEFFTSANGALFINGTFGAFTPVGANLPFAPVYPLASPAIRLRLQPAPSFYLQAGIYGNNTQSQIKEDYGFNLPDPSHGELLFWEAGYLSNPDPGSNRLTGNYKLGAFLDTSRFETWGSVERRSVNSASRPEKQNDYGVYAVVDQSLYQLNGRTIAGFVRTAAAPANVNLVSYYLETGFNFSGWTPGRSDDVFGIALARSSISGIYSDSQKLSGRPGLTAETVIEATYKAPVTAWCNLQPDFQYYFKPSGQSGAKNATVLSLRFTVAF